MKRRLNRAYDHMTMPDHCARRIEQQLRSQLQQKKTGRYTKAVSPVSAKRSGWATAVAAVCLVLTMSVGGTMLFLRFSESALERPAEPVTSFAAVETTLPETPEDFYAAATDLSAEEVEAFAAEIRQNVLDGDWEAFAEKVRYPIPIYNRNVGNDGGLVGLTIRNRVKDAFVMQMEKETCTAMFCNWQGICMAEGRIWINEVDGVLRITAINDMFSETAEDDSPDPPVLTADSQMNLYCNILEGDTGFYAGEFERTMTVGEYCDQKQKETGMAVTIPRFTLADLDGDGIQELILWICVSEETDFGWLVLRYDDSGNIRGWFFQYGQMFELKKDGSFSWKEGLGGGSGTAKLSFGDTGWVYEEVSPAEQSEKVAARWHTYPCQRPYLVLSTYESIAADQWGDPLGWQFFLFEELAKGNMEPAWDVLEAQLKAEDLRYTLDAGGSVRYVYDPESPGCWMSVSLNDSGQITNMEYYVCNEGGEFHVGVSGLLSDRSYEVMESASFRQRKLNSLEEVWDFFGQEALYSGGIRDIKQIRALAETFCIAWFAGDTATLRELAAKSSSVRVEGYPGGGEPTIISCQGLPDPMHLGDSCAVSVELLEPGQDSYSYLTMELIREEDGWKVLSYGLEK